MIGLKCARLNLPSYPTKAKIKLGLREFQVKLVCCKVVSGVAFTSEVLVLVIYNS